MNQLKSLMRAMTQAPHGICGAHDPASDMQSIADRNLRLVGLTLGALYDSLPTASAHWDTLLELSVTGHWLLSPADVAYESSRNVQAALQQTRLGGPRSYGRVWWQVCRGFQGRYLGDVAALIEDQQASVSQLLAYLGESKTTFPVLSAPVTSHRWLDLIHRIGRLSLAGWTELTVALPPALEEPAEALGWQAGPVHPAERVGLRLWQDRCKGDHATCGFDACPRRHNA